MPRFTKARRLGRDQEEEGRAELHDMLDDPEVSAGEMLAALVEHCPEDEREGVVAALRELTEDRRGRGGPGHAISWSCAVSLETPGAAVMTDAWAATENIYSQ